MAVNRDLVGREYGPARVSWSSKEALLYALGIGAGADDPLDELELTTENSDGVAQVAFPTFALVLEPAFDLRYGDYDPAMLVHAEQALELTGPIPVSGSADVRTTITGMYDKGSGALVVTRSSAVDAASGAELWRNTSAEFIRGEGGFGGDRNAPGPGWDRPDRGPDLVAEFRTHPEQALLYRLSGDRNPLHSDPRFAGRAGFSRPILHGLCTYGISARLALRMLGAPPGEFTAMSGRFTSPVTPGDTLQVRVWRTETPGEALFQTCCNDTVVLDRGRIRATPSAKAGAATRSEREADRVVV